MLLRRAEASDAQACVQLRNEPKSKEHTALRSLLVLEYFRESPQPATASFIARAIGLATSTADDLLKALVAFGYLTFHTTGKLYSPSARIFQLCEDLASGFCRASDARGVLARLQERTGGTVALCAQHRDHLVCVIVLPGACYESHTTVEGTDWPILVVDEGGWRPASSFATAILMSMTDREIMDLVSTCCRGQPDGEDAGGLLRKVAVARERGYALGRHPRIAGAMSAAIPWPGDPGAPPAAIGFVGIESDHLLEVAAGLPALLRNNG